MDRDTKIKEAQNHFIASYGENPEIAKDTSVAVARITEGLKCIVTDGDDQVIVDMGEGLGGERAGPTPGFYGRAAVSSCIAMGIKLSAIRAGISMQSVDVEIEMDWDNRGIFDQELASAAPIATRININIVSDASQDEIDNMVSRTLASSPWYLALKDEQKTSVEVNISQ